MWSEERCWGVLGGVSGEEVVYRVVGISGEVV